MGVQKDAVEPRSPAIFLTGLLANNVLKVCDGVSAVVVVVVLLLLRLMRFGTPYPLVRATDLGTEWRWPTLPSVVSARLSVRRHLEGV